MLGWLVHERGIELHTPVFDRRRDGIFERAEFAHDHKAYICLAGKELRQRQKTIEGTSFVDETA
jgi:hypothetical protein